MDQLIPSLALVLEAFRDCFRREVFETFQTLVVGWTLCPGPHTLSEVWQATGLAAKRHHDTAYAVFHSAAWEWDDLGKVLATIIITQFIPTGIVWLVVDDTLCHKRGAKVAWGGIFLDPVLSTKKHKTLRFGLNWVVLGIAVQLPWRSDRYYCLPVLWRVYRKKGQPEHRKRPALAAALARELALLQPDRTFWLVGDAAYLNASTLKDRPANLHVLGPLPWNAALYGQPEPRRPKQPGRPRKRGDRLPTPKAMLTDPAYGPTQDEVVALLTGDKRLQVRVVRDVLWYSAAGTSPVAVVLVQDPSGDWRDLALVASDPTVTAALAIAGYARRWSIEATFFDSKQLFGLHEPRVWSAPSVERAHPMAWFLYSLTLVWYHQAGQQGSQIKRERPWYRHAPAVTVSSMLGALRLQLWEQHLFGAQGDQRPSPETLKNLVQWVAAVR